MKFKKKMVDQIIRTKGRQFQHEGNSVYYLVGDIVKRNYNFLYDLHIQSYKNNELKSQENMQNQVVFHQRLQLPNKEEE